MPPGIEGFQADWIKQAHKRPGSPILIIWPNTSEKQELQVIQDHLSSHRLNLFRRLRPGGEVASGMQPKRVLRSSQSGLDPSSSFSSPTSTIRRSYNLLSGSPQREL